MGSTKDRESLPVIAVVRMDNARSLVSSAANGAGPFFIGKRKKIQVDVDPVTWHRPVPTARIALTRMTFLTLQFELGDL